MVNTGWIEEQQTSFEILKAKLTRSLILDCLDFSKTFMLQSDTSNAGLGAILPQRWQTTAYASKRLYAAQTIYPATEKECLAVIFGIPKMRPY